MDLVEQLKMMVEVEAKRIIEANSDKAVEAGLKKLAELIPGKVDDAILAAGQSAIQEAIKALLLSGADKISDKV